MVSSAAKTVPEYLESLPPERRAVVAELRELILRNLPPGYEERMNWGMLSFQIPLSRYPDTYNGQALGYVALAAQKNAYSLYLSGVYMWGEKGAREFREGFERAGKKLDMGKSCVRFRKVGDLALDVLAKSIASTSVEDYIRQYEKVRAQTAIGVRPRTTSKKAPTKAASPRSRAAAKHKAAARRPKAANAGAAAKKTR